MVNYPANLMEFGLQVSGNSTCNRASLWMLIKIYSRIQYMVTT
ncbi:hypothetical protein KsCSTR_34350 [Candidatus Kuenenia stuttgartiensis]|uniref:Uncharacterized protein n=1 Tax=Kuenenia stuttgartiensis TaxID=174633 RepID=A0A6G7GTY4_KUEST|nr:hypothetical protein KsCSTR_34350 [Candidatus Kuenenia stuttgartiensis]